MPRLRQPPLTTLAGAGLLTAALVAGSAHAQTATNSDPVLMRPALDGDQRNPPRFRRPRSADQGAGQSGIGQGPDFRYQPAVGAGTTGFNSTNVRRRLLKKAQKPKPGDAIKSPGRSTEQASAATATPAMPTGAASLPQNRERRGAPPAAALAASIGAPVIASPLRRRLAPEENPFSPTGIAAGAFLLRPAIELTGAYDTNPSRTAGGRGSAYYVIAPELLANSNWQRHELTATLRGSYTGYESATSLNRPNVDAKVNGRIDVTGQTRIDLETRFLVATENPGSPNIQADLAKLPVYTTLGGTAGFTQRFNRFEFTAKGSADRNVYQDSTFTDGTTASNEDRNYNLYATQLRVGYELMPGLKPFMEFGIDTRVHDLAVDRSGLRRDSDGYSAKAGTTFQYSPKLTGEMALGYLARSYKDPTLPSISGMTTDGSLRWTATALTTLKLTAKSSVSESFLPGVSGVFTRDLGIQVDHAFRRWLVGVVKLSRAHDNYEGLARQDNRYSATAALTYMLTRELQVKGEIRRDWLKSNLPASDYAANVVLFGVRLQR